MISFPIFNVIEPVGMFVTLASVRDVSEAVIAPPSVTLISEDTPVILTLLES